MLKNREFWLTMLYICVPIVNLGYLLISVSKSVEFALFGNDIAYLGSVFLSMCMLFTIIRLCGFEMKRSYVISGLIAGATVLFFVFSSPALPLFYKSVQIITAHGATKLVKEYGALHPLYMLYLLIYFAAMIAVIILSVKKNKIGKPKFAGFIAGIVCSNIVLWLFEKFIKWEFEFLAVMYIASELMLLLVYWMIQDYVPKTEVPPSVIVEEKAPIIIVDSMSRAEKIEKILSTLPEGVSLSPRQTDVLEGILDGKSRKEIAIDLHLSENTVKMHISSLYRLLDVSNRDELKARLKIQ